MPEIRHLTRPKPTVALIDLGDGDTVNVTFDRNKITPLWMEEAEKRDREKDTQSLPKSLADVILSWDVTNEGAAYPPLAENIAAFSYPVQAELLTSILAAAVPSRAEGNVSSGPSSIPPSGSEVPLMTPQNGAVTSPSLVPSASPSPT